ncbi:sensor histidine kinase [Nocardioides sp. URHA0020]|uniref:sensor histidine kinase n=1 Tax=Nocardioides sp. URHA0020 TaxID=1380392 RepID=UPI0012DEB31E|nr:HAMP domain-containing sensor histidine kinase [Nocardioides sp. URHA0020]
MTGRPVARVVSSVLARIGLLGALATTVAVIGVVVSAVAVTGLTDELSPAAAANQAIYQDLTEMSAAAESWASTGLPAAADDYRQATLRLGAHEQEVRGFAQGDRSLSTAVKRQEAAADAWVDGYAEPRMAAPGGAGTRTRDVRVGSTAFDAIRSAHQSTTQAFDSRVRSARDGVSMRLRGTVLAVVLVAALAAALITRSRRRLLGELSTPLLALEKVVQRMARGDHEVRAVPAGPKEVEAVAHALNDLADAQTRARAVEVWIQRELRTLDTAKDDFVANVSHELRTPLTTISGYLELVAEEFEGQIDPRHERMLDATRRNVARLKMLIDDLLTLQQAEGSNQQMEAVELAALLRDVVMDVKIAAARRGIRIGVRTPPLAVCVLADRAMLHRAFLNIVSNAVKFSHDDGIVDVVLSTARGQVEVSVTDRGIGIPSGEQDRLGTRFFRASNAVSNEIGGTGLGVRIMQTIVDRHAGAVAIESEEGVGTTVTVRLPAQSGPPRLAVTTPPPLLSVVASEPQPAPAP